MPYNFDFTKLKNIKIAKINPIGWFNPLYVEYGICDDAEIRGIPSYCWRVKGTKHTFVISVIRMDFLSSGNYEKHFEQTLENFREDYILWKEDGFITEWSQEYRQQYSDFIII
jgi:hypothetical protein